MSEPALGTRSAGALLRAAREKQGLHIAALAAAIKVSQRKLEALEADRVGELPDATFTRALAQTVCRTLKIDARPVLDLLPPAASVALEPGNGGLNAPFRDRPGRVEPGLAGVTLKPLMLGAAVLLLAAAAVYFVPGSLFKRQPQTAPAVSLPSPPVVAEPAASAAPPSFAPPPLVAEAASEPVAAPAPSASAPGVGIVAAAAADTAPAGSAATTAPEAVASASGLVQLRSSAACWVEARDARGRVLLSRTVPAGEAVGLDGALPIRLTIGNANAMQLAFRGQSVDLAPRTRDNVARLELQ